MKELDERAQVGGTLSANPLSCAAGYFAIEEMARTEVKKPTAAAV